MTLQKIFLTLMITLLFSNPVYARIKLVTLPDRDNTTVRLDNPRATLVEEERILNLHKGINKVDFSWKGVYVDSDSIRLKIIQHPKKTTLINVSYPPNSQSLVWDIYSPRAQQEKVRISYLLANIDRLVSYEAITDKDEKKLDISSYMILRNFSGESLGPAKFQLDYGQGFEKSINDGESKRMLFYQADKLNINKLFMFDAGKHPWEPDKQQSNVGIPVYYELENNKKNHLGKHALWGGKMRIYQNDNHDGSIFLGEDKASYTPVNQKMKLYVGDSRDVVVTQRKTHTKNKNIKRNRKNQIILHDKIETMQLIIENFKDKEATINIIEPMSGEWEIIKNSHPFRRKHHQRMEFTIKLPAKGKETLTYRYIVKNVKT
ncbi:MAG: hypothetical protein KAJ03_06285 [Gammaproteobacteria bacterium]|nr:hypothetical protein [Gammaproteobacteria bacterium]